MKIHEDVGCIKLFMKTVIVLIITEEQKHRLSMM